MSHSASADNPTFAHRELLSGVLEADDEGKPASKHKRIGRWGLIAAVCAAAVFVGLGGAAAGGLSNDLPRELWAWGRATLITMIVIGLVIAGFGYGVEGSNRREERSRVEMGRLVGGLRHDLTETKKAVDDHGHNVFVDHNALHRDALIVGQQLAQIREELAEMHAITAQTNLALSKDQLERIALEAGRQVFREIYAAVQEAARKRGGEARWSPDDVAWMDDVANAFNLGKQIGNDPA